MAAPLKNLRVANRQQWRAWLSRNHASSPGIWLVFYKAHTGITSMSIDDMVCEALCFGWIYSLIKRLDDERYAVKVTPRKPASKWSDSNRKRWRELKAGGLLAPAGIAAAPTSATYAPKPTIPILPAYIARALKTDQAAWRFFNPLPPRSRRDYVVWIHIAKKPETRDRRIRESISLLAAGKKLGLK
jgi:uncharacterized protein YdeI (YjbR/CyaY-like superfamily)